MTQPTNVRMTDKEAPTVTVAWIADPDAVTYRITNRSRTDRDAGKPLTTLVTGLPRTTLSYTFTIPLRVEQYRTTVVSEERNERGQVRIGGSAATTWNATIPDVVPAPVKVTGLVVTDSSAPTATVAWTSQSVTSYTVTVNGVATTGVLVNRHTFNVVKGTQYRVTVTAINASGTSPVSDTLTFTATAEPPPPPPRPTLTAPAKITGLVVTDNQAPTAVVSWTPADTATSYEVTVDGATTTGVMNTNHSFTVTSGTEYTVTVKGRNSAGLGPASDELKFTAVTAAASRAPRNFRVVTDLDRRNITLVWREPLAGGRPLRYVITDLDRGTTWQTADGYITNFRGVVNEGQTYRYTVHAVFAGEVKGPPSNTLTFTGGDQPDYVRPTLPTVVTARSLNAIRNSLETERERLNLIPSGTLFYIFDRRIVPVRLNKGEIGVVDVNGQIKPLPRPADLTGRYRLRVKDGMPAWVEI